MDNIKKARAILEKVLKYDEKTLEKVKVSEALTKLLSKAEIPKTVKEDLKTIDGLSAGKKKAFARYVLSIMKNIKEKSENEPFTESLTINDIEKISVQSLKILKPVEKRALKKVGADNVRKALFYFPIRYDDKRIKTVKQVIDGESGVFKVKVKDIKKVNRGKIKVEVLLEDKTGYLKAYFVHDKPFLFNIFRKDRELFISGKISVFRGEKSIFQPEIYNIEDSVIIDRITPVYSLRGDSSIKISGQTLNHLRRAMFKILKRYYRHLSEYMPFYILEKYKLPEIKEALRKIHFPPDSENIDLLNDYETRYQKRFIFEELFLLQLAQEYRKYMLKQEEAERIEVEDNFVENFEKNLPFELTNAQKKAIKEIIKDISRAVPMNRMVQGDVGSGKTVVAIAASYATALNGKQTAVMAPTEILAKQHFNNFKTILEPLGIKVGFLSGSMTQKEKRQINRAIKEGYIDIIIGTHALIQEGVEFNNLSLVIVDEQHRFGVKQRKSLTEKSHKSPHVLVMTATPIPRTLTMTYYGDLDVSIINELPKGRKPVKTMLIYDDERKSLYEKIKKELSRGRQVFVVYPLIEETEKSDLKSAEEGFKHWQEAFPDKKVVMLHGKMKQEEKDKTMDDFKNKKADILVSTTVIEVGVDIPNASVMVIEEAHRFGLSQIHQLRGRIGRGQHEGYCYLVAPAYLRRPAEETTKENQRLRTLHRLRVLVKTNDGFKIAEEDLKLRGTGDLVGTAQSGKINFSIADLDRPIDIKILKFAKKEAQELIKKDPQIVNYPQLRQLLFDKYGERFELATVA